MDEALAKIIAGAFGGTATAGAVVWFALKTLVRRYLAEREEFEARVERDLERLREEAIEEGRRNAAWQGSRIAWEKEIEGKLAGKNGESLRHLGELHGRLRQEHDNDHKRLGDVEDYMTFMKARDRRKP